MSKLKRTLLYGLLLSSLAALPVSAAPAPAPAPAPEPYYGQEAGGNPELREAQLWGPQEAQQPYPQDTGWQQPQGEAASRFNFGIHYGRPYYPHYYRPYYYYYPYRPYYHQRYYYYQQPYWWW